MLSLIIISFLFYLGVEAGQSWSWSYRWQTNSFKRAIPEILLAIIFAGIASLTYEVWGFSEGWQDILTLIAGIISYAGIQTTRWLFIQWDTKHKDFDTERGATIKPFVDWLAWKIGLWEKGEEGYSWTAAVVVGSIICFPFALILSPLGGLFFACGYEIGSHFKGRVTKFNPQIISEGMSFALLGAFSLFFI